MKELTTALRLFGLSASATFEEVKTAYRKAVLNWHPDRFTDDEGMRNVAEERIKELNVAYDFLARHFSRRTHTVRDEDKPKGKSSANEPITLSPLDPETFSLNLAPDGAFPLLYEGLLQMGVKNIIWNTYTLQFIGVLEPRRSKAGSNLDVEVAVTSYGHNCRAKFRFAFSNESDNVRLGFVEGPDYQAAVTQVLRSPLFGVDARTKLRQVYYQDFQLHEVTWSEISRGRVSVAAREGGIEFHGATANQVLNTVYKAFEKNGVQSVFWNIHRKVILGRTGWSLRSCGQLVEVAAEGTGRDLVLTMTSTPLTYGGRDNRNLSDLGRGQEEIKSISAHILAQFRP